MWVLYTKIYKSLIPKARSIAMRLSPKMVKTKLINQMVSAIFQLKKRSRQQQWYVKKTK
jgi:hypothetical protein